MNRSQICSVASRYVLVFALLATQLFASSVASALGSINPDCLPNKSYKAKLVTHYYVPLLERYDAFVCDQMEGTCIYNRGNEPWLHNFGYQDRPLSQAVCKNGYGNRKNCLHPCRALAASMKHHRYGQVVYFKELVGKKCGDLARDGFEMIHDGYAVVLDTGSPNYFAERGRFDFFWGRCRDRKNGICLEGAQSVSASLTQSDYCTVWDPGDPLKNQHVKIDFVNKVVTEAIQRADGPLARAFELDSAIGVDRSGKKFNFFE
jgi:hypothetical protein